ncbi:MAG: hypothetical protein K9G70_03185 [Prolixibacteraceae bacterium]|nr:hypothetical protein [Prolixibacteraceae bacterium]
MNNIYNIVKVALVVFLLLSCNTKEQGNNAKGKTEVCDIDRKIDNGVDSIVNSIPKLNFPDTTINLIEYAGFAPDKEGTHNFQPVLNKAISELSASGGGTVYLTSTSNKNQWVKETLVYRMDGPINMASNIRLLLDYSTKIKFTYKPENYLDNGKGVITRWEGVSIKSFSPLIRGFNVENVAIEDASGNGAMPVIDGDGEKWGLWSYMQSRDKIEGKQPYKHALHLLSDSDVKLADRERIDVNKDFYRPSLMQFYLSKNISVEGVQLRNTPFWTVHFVFSENATVRNVIFDVHNENSDGVDPESSHNILIENCHFNNHDDNVAIKSGRNKEGREGVDVSGTVLEGIESKFIKANKIYGATENVVIRNNVLKGHHAICIGSEVAGSVRNVFAVDNICVQDVIYALYIKSSPKRGGVVEDIYIRNMKINKARMALVLNPCYAQQDTVSTHYPLFRNIYIKDIRINKATKGAIDILGWPELPIENVFIENLTIDNIKEKGEGGSINVRNAKNVILKDVKIEGALFEGDYSDDSGENPPPDV